MLNTISINRVIRRACFKENGAYVREKELAQTDFGFIINEYNLIPRRTFAKADFCQGIEMVEDAWHRFDLLTCDPAWEDMQLE